jgi:two-component system response regulator DevR
VRILLVGEHALLLQGLMKLLEDEVAAEVRTVRRLADVEAAIEQWIPALAILETTGNEPIQELISSLSSLQRDVPVLVIAPGEPDQFLAALRAGARGFVGRHISVEDLLHIVEIVQRGGWGIPESLIGSLVEEYLLLVRERTTSPTMVLSKREQQVLAFLAQGMNARRIGEQMFLSASTVRGDIRGIVRKLGVANRTQAVAEALRRDLLHVEDQE